MSEPEVCPVPLSVPLPVLWVCGPSGVGKSAAAWELFEELAAEDRRDGSDGPCGEHRLGRRTAYVDIDQIGMCYPPLADDPERHALKARALAAVTAAFRAAGARGVVVSGIVDPERGTRGYEDALRGLAVTAVRLRCEPDLLRRRFLGRDGTGPRRSRRCCGRRRPSTAGRSGVYAWTPQG